MAHGLNRKYSKRPLRHNLKMSQLSTYRSEEFEAHASAGGSKNANFAAYRLFVVNKYAPNKKVILDRLVVTDKVIVSMSSMDELDEELKNELKETYTKAKLALEQALQEDPREPYKGKYEIRTQLFNLKVKLVDRFGDLTRRGIVERSVLSGIDLIIGSIDMDVEELQAGEDSFNRVASMLEEDATDPTAVLLYITCLNQLGYLWSVRGNDEKALDILKRAEAIYNEYTSEGLPPPVNIDRLFCNEPPDDTKGKDHLEKMHTMTLYYLAQVYKSLNLNEKSAVYCHSTLKRQLELSDFGKIDWALNAATLSQYLTEQNAFKEARHLLIASDAVLDMYQKELDDVVDDSEQLAANKEQLKHRRCDVARCWTKYCLMLLNVSKQRLLESDNEEHGAPIPLPPATLTGLFFPSLLLENEDKVCCDYLLVYDDAKPVFLFGQVKCAEAMTYYTMNEHASDHVRIVQDLSQLYLGLIFFEENEDNQSKMHKRRFDLLTGVESKLNPNYYMDLCRELWMELGVICTSMSEIKISKISSSASPSPQAVAKSNRIISDGLNYFDKFLSSFKDKKTNSFPDTVDEENERNFLVAHLYSAGLAPKLIVEDKLELLKNNSLSLDHHKAIINYCERNKRAAEEFAQELGISKEMLRLLPVKLAKITAQINC